MMRNARSHSSVFIRSMQVCECAVALHQEQNPTTPMVVVVRVGDAWLVGVGKRAPHAFRWPGLVSPHGSLGTLEGLYIISSTSISKG